LSLYFLQLEKKALLQNLKKSGNIRIDKDFTCILERITGENKERTKDFWTSVTFLDMLNIKSFHSFPPQVEQCLNLT
jgi:hypothetical protein